MKSWFETLVGTTRARLIALLRRSERSIADLAMSLRISGNAVRGHVSALQRDGLVEPSGVERATGGKPATLYRLTPEAEELFPKAYAYVLGAMLSVLEERLERAEVEAVLSEIGRRAASASAHTGVARQERFGRGSAGTSDGSDADRTTRADAERAAAGLRAIGGDVDVEPMGGGWRLVGHGCPLSAVVSEHEVVCTLARALVAELSGGDVRECCDRSQRPSCRFEVLGEA